MLRNTTEGMSIFGNVFLLVNVLDEFLMNSTMIREIWQHYWRF